MTTAQSIPLRCLRNDILFQFEEESTYFTDKKIRQKGFKEVTDWGLIIVNPNTNAKQPRWGIVVVAGPECNPDDIKPGRRILIENLMWTNAIEYDKQEYWKTNEDKVIGVDNTED